MQVVSTTRRLSRVSKTLFCLTSDRFLAYQSRITNVPPLATRQCRNSSTVSSQNVWFSGTCNFNGCAGSISPMGSMKSNASFSSEATNDEGSPTETVKEIYDKMLQSVVSLRSMPPNAWLWSLIENCKNYDDIKLLFNILEKLRIFRLSNLRIHENFNSHLCQEVTKACVRVGALDFGKKALWKHNVYGLSPHIGSVHHLLSYANQHTDSKLMVEIMDLVKHNDLPLQPGTADIVVSICYKSDNWKLISKYVRRFVKAGVKLRPTTFDLWMEFAAKIGDVESLWKAEELRSKSMKRHTIVTGVSCAKGFLLEHKPEDAAAIIQALNQGLTDAKRPDMLVELQKLVSEWPSEVVKNQKAEGKRALATSLKSDIPTMVALLNMDLEVNVDNLEDLSKEGSLC